MTNENFKIYNDILNGTLDPTLPINTNQSKFEILGQDFKPSMIKDFGEYSFTFFEAFDAITIYYHKLISSEISKSFENLELVISKESSQQVLKFLHKDIFQNHLNGLLVQLSEMTKKRAYKIEDIQPDKIVFVKEQFRNSHTYIFYLLKNSLIRLYLELQFLFDSEVFPYLSESAIYQRILKEPVPPQLTFHKKMEQSTTVPLVKVSKSNIPINSFLYSGKIDNLKFFYYSLKDKLYMIAPETTLPQFKKIFSNEKITNPVVWLGTLQELYFLVKTLHKDKALIGDLKENHWQVTVKCFIQSSGEPYDYKKFRGQKDPASASKIKISTNLLG